MKTANTNLLSSGAFMYACPDIRSHEGEVTTVHVSSISPEEIRAIIREEFELFARQQMADALAKGATRKVVAEDLEYTCPECWKRD